MEMQKEEKQTNCRKTTKEVKKILSSWLEEQSDIQQLTWLNYESLYL